MESANRRKKTDFMSSKNGAQAAGTSQGNRDLGQGRVSHPESENRTDLAVAGKENHRRLSSVQPSMTIAVEKETHQRSMPADVVYPQVAREPAWIPYRRRCERIQS